MKKQLLIASFIIVLFVPVVFGGIFWKPMSGHMKLLAVTDTDKGYIGSTADLYLEIKPGTGRVFIDTYPLTKVDTQMSTRFAQEIACDFLEIDCDRLDFFYTIRAQSAIIGGPSAGGALTILTISLLDDTPVDENVAMTGTINSGGLIGPVSGLKYKIDAAHTAGISTVLIPSGERVVREDITEKEENLTPLLQKAMNDTIDLVEYGARKGMNVAEVASLPEALLIFTGKNYSKARPPAAASSEYDAIMGDIAQSLCNRSKELQKEVARLKLTNSTAEEKGVNLTGKGADSFYSKMYYSSASYCFGANIQFSYALLKQQNLTPEDTILRVAKLRIHISDFDEQITKNGYSTITDLETYMVVKERITEAYDRINDTVNYLNDSDQAAYSLAYATERFHSAQSWSRFFGQKGKRFMITKEALKQSCIAKIAEAEERYQYANIIFPSMLSGIREGIERAADDSINERYELCLYKASKVKAQANVILNALGVEEKQISNQINVKTSIISDAIAEKEQNGIFPLVGYSFYEYAQSLKDDDHYSTLLYLEYALELSNLDIYFDKTDTTRPFRIDPLDLHITILFFMGVVFGFALNGLLHLRKRVLFKRQSAQGQRIKQTASRRGPRRSRVKA